MKNILYIIIWIAVPFLGTTLGSSLVFSVKNNIKETYKKIFYGFSGGVMISASIWSLILPSLELTNSNGLMKCIPCSIGFLLGILFLLLINVLSEKLESIKNFNMLMFSVTLHNIPEGMVVGIGLAGFLSSVTSLSLHDAIMIAICIAIQNIPDGAIVALPIKFSGKSSKHSFLMGVTSGIVEPIATIITLALSNKILPFLPILLSFAGGAMFFVVINELIPEFNKNKKSFLGILGFSFGFILMMIMDVCFG